MRAEGEGSMPVMSGAVQCGKGSWSDKSHSGSSGGSVQSEWPLYIRLHFFQSHSS